MRFPSKDTGCLHYDWVLQEDLIIFRWCPASFDRVTSQICSRLQTHKCAEMIPHLGLVHASQDRMWHLRMRTMHLRNMSALSDFPNIFARQCRRFFAEPEPELKTSLAYTTATGVHAVKSALAQGLRKCPPTITHWLPVPSPSVVFHRRQSS